MGDVMTPDDELRAMRLILKHVEKLSPASRKWLVERIIGNGSEAPATVEPSKSEPF